MLFAIGCIFLMLAYRLRGGGFYNFGNDTIPRLIWALCFSLVAVLPSTDISELIRFGILFLITSFISVSSVPHAFCQSMGRNLTYEKAWPAWFVPNITQTEWSEMSLIERAMYDAVCMSGVAFARAAIIYIPYGFLTHDFIECANATLAIIILQPIGYLLGYLIPFTLPSLEEKSTDWGELFNGIGWAVSLSFLKGIFS